MGQNADQFFRALRRNPGQDDQAQQDEHEARASAHRTAHRVLDLIELLCDLSLMLTAGQNHPKGTLQDADKSRGGDALSLLDYH